VGGLDLSFLVVIIVLQVVMHIVTNEPCTV
jgi:uncharacterized protein YggT (Ycf19 family)